MLYVNHGMTESQNDGNEIIQEMNNGYTRLGFIESVNELQWSMQNCGRILAALCRFGLTDNELIGLKEPENIICKYDEVRRDF